MSFLAYVLYSLNIVLQKYYLFNKFTCLFWVDPKLIVGHYSSNNAPLLRLLGYERVYMPLYKVVDTPFHNQGQLILIIASLRQNMRTNF